MSYKAMILKFILSDKLWLQDQTWSKFSTLEEGVCVPCTYSVVTTLSIMTFNITILSSMTSNTKTFSTTIKNATHSIMTVLLC